jgi:small subunit ribosomal protein S4e
MGRRSGATRVKRQMAPTFWDIRRKESQFVMRVKPGPHPKKSSYPLGMVLRDAIKVTHTAKESQLILNEGKVKVDGITRRDSNLAVGLMDVVELANGQAYRLVPKDSELLVPVAVEETEKAIKLAKITSKVTIKGNKLQYGFHDGKTLITDANMKVGDTCLFELPGAKVTDHIKFEKGATALIITGENAGKVGKIEEIREGIFSLPTRAFVSVDDRTVELPVEMVMVVGKDKPLIKVS